MTKSENNTTLADIPSVLPADAKPYRILGPFDKASLPAGVLRQHRLGDGRWGLLRVHSGSIRFIWDDRQGNEVRVTAGQTVLIPPLVTHHLEPDEEMTLSIELYSSDAR